MSHLGPALAAVAVAFAFVVACGDDDEIGGVADSAPSNPAAFCESAARLDEIDDGDGVRSAEESAAALDAMESLAAIAPAEIASEFQALIDNEIQMMSGAATFDPMSGEMEWAQPVPGSERWEVVQSYLITECDMADPMLVGIPLALPE